MLDKETKDRINTARDILVGKVPDPKSQVEQITIALIYKFMDDMDLEAEELGGARSFFSGEYAPYAWHKLFDPAVGGEARLQRYSEALLRLGLNPNLPALFRDIFKNAYLPYRDPETLSSFLKIINGFRYDHSERLGDAFEFLLSVLGSQGDAGQFRTPRHLIDFMTAMVDPQKDETVLDPACGTAGFLISSYKHILKHNSANYDPQADPAAFELHGISLDELGAANGKKYKGDRLSPDDRKRLVQNFRGYDISPDMVRLSLVNLYLHGFSEPRIYEYDTLTSEARWNEYYDVILANPPFMSPKGGIRPHNRFSIASNRSEVLFVDYIAEHLTPRGRAAIIVPEGIIFQTGTAYKALRKMLVESGFLVGVVSLPAGVFNPYSGVKTSILWIDKTLASKTDQLLFLKIENDGFDLGAQRRPLKSSELPEAFRQIEAYKRALQNGTPFDAEHLPNVALVEKTKVAEGGEYGLSGERYRGNVVAGNSNVRLVELGEIATIEYGYTTTAQEEGEARFIRITDIDSNGQLKKKDAKYVTITPDSEGYLLSKHDLLVARTGATYGKTLIFEEDYPAIFASYLIRIRFNQKEILPKFYWSFAQSDFYWQQAQTLVTGGGQPQFNGGAIKKLQIPLPPLPVQEEIVAEIEGYERIIAGARQVVESYRPRIEIQPEWEWVELGEVCEVNPKKSQLKEFSSEMEVSFAPMADLNENEMDFEAKEVKKLAEVINGYTYFADNDVLLAKVTPCFENGKAGIARNLKNGIGFGSSEYYVFRASEKVLPIWIYLAVSSDDFRKSGKLVMTGTGGLQRVPKEFVSTYKIPLPDLPTQARIVAAIERERALVAGCRELMAVMEEKVRRRVAGVWGE
jgi:type I restriction enzyme M protein